MEMDSVTCAVTEKESFTPPPTQDGDTTVANGYSEEQSQRQLRQLQSLLEGYSLSNSEGYPVLSLCLPDGTQWSKLIWTRTTLPKCLYRWNTPEEVLSYLISFDDHKRWVTDKIQQRPPTGTIKLYNKTKTRNFREDGYDWKTRYCSKKAVREDRMKLKVLGQQLICATYSHSESNPHFHRRSYWFTQNPDMVLVHYLETEANSHNKNSLKKLQENGFEVTMEGTVPADYALLAISDTNICKYLANGHDGEKPHPLLCSLSKCVWNEASNNPESCLGMLIKNLNEKLLANITREVPTEQPPVISDAVPLRLLSEAIDLLRLQAFSAQYGDLGLLPKGAGCLPPNVLLQAVSLIMCKHSIAPPVVCLPPGVQFTIPQNNIEHLQPLLQALPQQPIEGDVLHPINPPSLESIRCFLPASFETEVPTTSSVTNHRTDINIEDFSRFAQNLRTMNPLKDLQHLKVTQPPLSNTVLVNGVPSDPTLHSDSVNPILKSSQKDEPTASDMSILEEQANSLLSPHQITDLISMDFESTSGLRQPATDNGVTSDNINGVNLVELNSFNTETFLEQFFCDMSATPPVPFNPDSLLHNPVTSNCSSQLQQVDCNDDPFGDITDPSKQLNIDGEILAQLLNTDSVGHDENPPSPLTCYIESLVPPDVIRDQPSPTLSNNGYYEDHPVAISNNIIRQGLEEDVTSTEPMPDSVGNTSTSCSPIGETEETLLLSTIGASNDLNDDSILSLYPNTLFSHTRSPVNDLAMSYRTNSPLPSPSSPSLASVSSLSTVGGESYFDQTDPPLVAELCEMLGESRGVQNSDFSHLSLSDTDQQQLIKASLVIQNTMKKCKDNNYNLREKDAALCIERNYRRYRELKRMRDTAARRIQLHYRLYRRRTQELNRATLFIQQMYRYQRRKHHSRK